MMRGKLGFERGAFARTAAFGGWITFSTHSERISVGGKLFRTIASSVVESGLEMEDCWDISFLRERNEGRVLETREIRRNGKLVLGYDCVKIVDPFIEDQFNSLFILLHNYCRSLLFHQSLHSYLHLKKLPR